MPKAPPKSHSAPLTTSTAPYTLPPICAAPPNPPPHIVTTPTYVYAAPPPPPPPYQIFHFPPPNAATGGNTLPPIFPPPGPIPSDLLPASDPQSARQSPSSSCSPTSTSNPAALTAPAPKPKRITKNNEDPLPWLEIKLEGEEDGTVPVYDSCNEVRRKIRAFFGNTSGIKCTQKRFLEVIGNVNCNSYRRFMALKGEGSGAENGTFYGAYVFFEKRRIYEGKPKGKKRLESERDYPNGRPLQDDARHRYYLTGPGLPPMTQKQIRMSVARYGY